ncbi:hypothetical protein [Chondromyces crocatus]|uniref:DUF4276 family protein n=1 Tax=Chondromyces crocatus TaxID=52 RepID=A0A0K1E9E7_CHOCO|nr:hypothetical protein [Chondromyces crocatus]AKT37474.1 uncharacterized protein CMC5_016150 [Chondromyces crocatus]
MTPIRVGIICEGTTDDAVLRAIVGALVHPRQVVFALLQPDSDRLQPRTGPGWQGVRKFLKEAPELSASPLDLIVVHVDADVRGSPEVTAHLRAVEEGEHDLEPLCDHVKDWMISGVPDAVVIVLPRERTESWLLAANSKVKHVEAIAEPDRMLPDPGSRGKREKSRPAYEALVQPLLPLLSRRNALRGLPELERFCGKVGSRIRKLSSASGASSRGARGDGGRRGAGG